MVAVDAAVTADIQAAYQLFCAISLPGIAGGGGGPPPPLFAGIPGSPASAYKQEPSLQEHVSPSRELLQHSLQLRIGSPSTS